MKQIAVFVTGQLRNASEHVENWLNTAFINCNPTFFFTVWDEVGKVDKNKIYAKSLKLSKKKDNLRFVEVSDNNIYFYEKLNLENEIKKIKRIIPNACFRVFPYKLEYIEKIGDLEISEELKKDTHPFWQGWLPVSYLNKVAIEEFKKQYNPLHFDAYVRLQSETVFAQDTCIDWEFKKKFILTSPNTINPEHQLSIKFFAGLFEPFYNLMNTYDYLQAEFKQYKSETTPPHQRPIGERYLKQLASKFDYKVEYSVKTQVIRQRVYPMIPKWKKFHTVKKTWNKSTLIPLGTKEINSIKSTDKANDLNYFKEDFIFIAHNYKTPDVLRELAISYEDIDLNTSKNLMSIAYQLRPQGSFIEAKLRRYQNLINKQAKD